MATQEPASTEITYGDRFQKDKFYELYQKAVELGTWDVERVIDKAPVEKDRETWEQMDQDDMVRWGGFISGFLDGEHEVAQDATKLVQMVGSPYLDNQPSKEAFFTTLQFEETKHTQFVSWYADNVVPDEIMPKTGVGVRRGLTRLLMEGPDQDIGLTGLFNEQRDALNTAIYTREPRDIARAATVYNLHVEGLFARMGFHRMKEMHNMNPLPTWINTFELISTDEGRHITAGIELVREIVEKEQAGDVDFQGVSDVVWDQVQQDVWRLAMVSVLQGNAVAMLQGRGDDEEFIDQEIDQQVDLFIRYTNDMYRNRIGLPTYDEEKLRTDLDGDIEDAKDDISSDYLMEAMSQQEELEELLEQEQQLIAGD